MFGDRGTSFPATGLAVVVLFLTTAFLGPRAFESLRQAESDIGKRAHLAEPTVEARLWEDPLVALLRHQEKLKGICSGSSEEERKAARDKPACKDGQPQTVAQFRREVSAGDKWTAIAALLPGATFIGGEEARRRQRYALLAGLNAAGYVPDNSERMGAVIVPRCFDLKGCSNEKSELEIPFETLSMAPAEDGQRRRVVVLWVDDTKIGRRWLSAITVLLTELTDEHTRLRVIGPSDSDRLVKAVEDISIMALEAQTLTPSPYTIERLKFEDNWNTLARIHLISPNSTASTKELVEAVRLQPGASPDPELSDLNRIFGHRLEAVERRLESGRRPSKTFFIRTIGTDDRLIDELVKELCSRGLDPLAKGKSTRVILMAEWDSIYARTFEKALRSKLEGKQACGSAKTDIQLDSYQYLRGLDGLTLDGTPASTRRIGELTRGEKDRQGSPIEWPEGREQRDYLRRLLEQRVGSNQTASPKNAIQAIGVIGIDVHDKLIVAQAVRSAFPDRTFFTTDMDARLVHPDVLQHTRNLIVASSLPLSLKDKLQCGNSPFRDTYQTAMFLAGRYAATVIDDEAPDLGAGLSCGGVGEGDIQKMIAEESNSVRLFEIGRDGAVELEKSDLRTTSESSSTNRAPDNRASPASTDSTSIALVDEAATHKRRIFAVLAGAVLLILGMLMTFVMPGPAMQAAWPWWWSGTMMPGPTGEGPVVGLDPPTPRPERPRGTFILVAAIQAAALGFALGVVIELAFPGVVELSGAILGAGLAAAVVIAAFLFRDSRVGNADISIQRARVRRWTLTVLLVSILLGIVGVCCGLLSSGRPPDDLREPFAIANGTSAWPSQLLRTLSIVLFAWFLDYALCKSAQEADDIGWRYFSQSSALPGVKLRLRHILKAIVWDEKEKRTYTVGVSGARLWKAYRIRLRSWLRIVRIGVGLIVAALVVIAARYTIGGAWPEIPARGIADRQLFLATSWIAALSMIFMMVLVADTTILTWRFITLLKRGRTFYPQSTVMRFAAELGCDDKLQAQATRRFPARLTQRRPYMGNNSLLDDWIDARLFAQHTAVIGPLIVFPFILLALMIVARSRFFDNWDTGGFVLIIFAIFVSWAVAMAIVLNHGADLARRVALERMERDRLWLKGAGDSYKELAAQFPGLIDQVRTLRQGAFAPFFEQPLVQAILVPLGGAGGIQLLDLVMQGRL